MQVNLVNFVNKWLTKLAAEIVFIDYEENYPDKLKRLQRSIAKYGYPEQQSEEDRIIWEVYRNRYSTGI